MSNLHRLFLLDAFKNKEIASKVGGRYGTRKQNKLMDLHGTIGKGLHMRTRLIPVSLHTEQGGKEMSVECSRINNRLDVSMIDVDNNVIIAVNVRSLETNYHQNHASNARNILGDMYLLKYNHPHIIRAVVIIFKTYWDYKKADGNVCSKKEHFKKRFVTPYVDAYEDGLINKLCIEIYDRSSGGWSNEYDGLERFNYSSFLNSFVDVGIKMCE